MAEVSAGTCGVSQRMALKYTYCILSRLSIDDEECPGLWILDSHLERYSPPLIHRPRTWHQGTPEGVGDIEGLVV